ncbi:transposase [Turicibacter sp. H121]
MLDLIKECVAIKKYNTEFKSMIVELYKKGRLVKDLSREYGVSEVTIYK